MKSCKYCGYNKLIDTDIVCPICGSRIDFIDEEYYEPLERIEYSLAVDIFLCLMTGFFWFIVIMFRPKYRYKYKINRNTLSQGTIGENMCYAILENNLQDIPHKTLRNLYVPYDNENTTEIDVLLITKSGLYIIESKYYNSWIYGNENDDKWTETFSNGYKAHFYNPIKQNKLHISILRKLLKNDFKILPIISYVVFSNNAELKTFDKDKYNEGKNKLYSIHEFNTCIQNDLTNQKEILSEKDIDRIYSILEPFSKVDENIKTNHINRIQEKYN